MMPSIRPSWNIVPFSSFPRSAACFADRRPCADGTRSVPACVPTRSVGTRTQGLPQVAPPTFEVRESFFGRRSVGVKFAQRFQHRIVAAGEKAGLGGTPFAMAWPVLGADVVRFQFGQHLAGPA